MCCDLLSSLDDDEENELVPEGNSGAVKNMLLVGLAKCIKHGGVGLADVIGKYDLFVKAVNATLVDPASPMIVELLKSYPEVCTKTLLQSEDCLKDVVEMLRHDDARCQGAACDIFTAALKAKGKVATAAISKAGMRNKVIGGLGKVGGAGSGSALGALGMFFSVGMTALESSTVAEMVVESVTAKIVGLEGDIEEGDDR